MAKARVMRRNEQGQMEEVAVEPQIITKELASLIGTQTEPLIFEVERGAIRRYAQAVDDPNPLYSDVEYARQSKYGEIICPPGFFGWPIKPSTAAASLFYKIREQSGGRTPMDNGGETEFMLPVRAGDTLTMITKIADIYEEIGRSGNRLLLSIFERSYINQNGDLVARARTRSMFV